MVFFARLCDIYNPVRGGVVLRRFGDFLFGGSARLLFCFNVIQGYNCLRAALLSFAAFLFNRAAKRESRNCHTAADRNNGKGFLTAADADYNADRAYKSKNDDES